MNRENICKVKLALHKFNVSFHTLPCPCICARPKEEVLITKYSSSAKRKIEKKMKERWN
jgi:hypothetical protein